MENLYFRKKLIWAEIQRLKHELEKNQEFINLFQKQNNDLLKQIEKQFKEIEIVGEQLLKIETEQLIKHDL